MAQGHLHRKQKNLQLTKEEPTKETENKEVLIDYFALSPEPNDRCKKVAYMVIDRSNLTTVYQDPTSRFPYKTRQGNEYILASYYYNANCILAQPVKTGMQPPSQNPDRFCTIN